MEYYTIEENKKVVCKEKFLLYFPKGFYDEKYISWERQYKWKAHLQFQKALNEKVFLSLLAGNKYSEIVNCAIVIETNTNLLFPFEKLALRNALNTPQGEELFATELYNYLYGTISLHHRFENFAELLSQLPRKQIRVHTWSLQTVFAFIANPKEFIFLKPKVTRAAAKAYGYDLFYDSTPCWKTYLSLLDFAEQIKNDLADLKPRDMIDVQSFIWVLGSQEYD
jgi:hypothetical protein